MASQGLSQLVVHKELQTVFDSRGSSFLILAPRFLVNKMIDFLDLIYRPNALVKRGFGDDSVSILM
jgi:hypothetical protein